MLTMQQSRVFAGGNACYECRFDFNRYITIKLVSVFHLFILCTGLQPKCGMGEGHVKVIPRVDHHRHSTSREGGASGHRGLRAWVPARRRSGSLCDPCPWAKRSLKSIITKGTSSKNYVSTRFSLDQKLPPIKIV